jgi:hypothetical protein
MKKRLKSSQWGKFWGSGLIRKTFLGSTHMKKGKKL